MHSKLHQLLSMQPDIVQNAARSTVSGPKDLLSGSPFVCPGANGSVTRAVHLARLNAAWSGCDQCEWRFDTEGLAKSTAVAIDRIQIRRRDGVRRTEFGIRGQYINQLNRRAVARLVRVFCYDLLRQSTEHDGELPRIMDELPQLRRMKSPAVIAGYDSRASAPDIFVGVTSAIREFGMPVIDLGRCTAASAMEAVRSYPDSAGAVIVTGAGAEPSFTGVDVFDRQGHPVPVIWSEHGIRLQSVTDQRSHGEPQHAGSIVSDNDPDAAESQGIQVALLLPEDSPSDESRYRISRDYGHHIPLEFEHRYRQWLIRWYPRTSLQSVMIRCDDPLIVERIQWLSAQSGFAVVCRSRMERSSTPEQSWTMMIDEDDRQFCLLDSTGHRLSGSELAGLINSHKRSQSSHVTAHADDASDRFWLGDAGRPSSGRSTEQIRDALAVLGLVLQLKST